MRIVEYNDLSEICKFWLNVGRISRFWMDKATSLQKAWLLGIQTLSAILQLWKNNAAPVDKNIVVITKIDVINNVKIPEYLNLEETVSPEDELFLEAAERVTTGIFENK